MKKSRGGEMKGDDKKLDGQKGEKTKETKYKRRRNVKGIKIDTKRKKNITINTRRKNTDR